MNATILFGESEAARNGAEVSRPDVGFVAGDRPRFADETAELLRKRLTAAALVISLTLTAAFVGNFVVGHAPLWGLRALVLAILVGCFALLRRVKTLELFELRLIEVVVFGMVIAQLSLMMVARIGEYAAQNETAPVLAVWHSFLGAWCVLILIYGTFIPNSWRRGLALMAPVAVIPYAVLAIQCWLSPRVAELFERDHAISPVPMPLVAALVGTYGAFIINTARREAFKARQFGQYRLIERLGSGGMGEVHKAEHVLLKRPCALKLIKPESQADADTIARFEKEVKATAKLTHWNTVEIYDYGRTDDGTFYYVMELLPGMSFEDLVSKHGALPAERVVHLLRQVCAALQEAHGVGLIHRDIKPANIFAAQRGGIYDVAKLLDFGLVKERARTDDGDKAGYGFSGTPQYMSPEQATAYENVDGRADLYSLGAVGYYLLTGRPPFTGNLTELLTAHAGAEVASPATVNPKVPEDVAQVVLKCLAKKPDDRYPDAASLAAALAACQCANAWGPEQAARWWALEVAIPMFSTVRS